MSKKTIFTFIGFIGLHFMAISQDNLPNNLQDLQGIWLYVDTPEDPNTNNTKSITINKGFKWLALEYEVDSKKEYLREGFLGFQDSSAYNIKRINISNLKNSGKYYTELSSVDEKGNAKVPDFSTPEIVELTENTLWVNYGKISIYEKLDKLSAIDISLLYKRGEQDKRSYLKEYLDIDVKEIIAIKSIIYSEPNIPTKMYLIKGDIITVLEEQDGWLKIEYEGKKVVTGWIKKQDVRG